MVPPFGWEDVCSYRPLRFLAQSLSSQGFPVLRFDLPGTGDSSGGARDPGLWEAWIASIGDAADELRAASGVEDVIVIGVRLGAMVSVLAAARGANIQDLILWGPSATGRAVLREMKALNQMERWEYGYMEAPPAPPDAGMEAGGFILAPETQRALEELDLSSQAAQLERRRVLILTRDELPADAKLVRALEAAECRVEVKPGPGYGGMMALPNEAMPPVGIDQTMIEFIHAGRRPYETRPEPPGREPASCAVLGDRTQGIRESIFTIDHAAENAPEALFGILSEPGPQVERSDWGVVFLNAGGVRHIGPNRMWVDTARRWAAQGVVSLRLDLKGIGESEGEKALDIPALYQDRLVEQVERALAALQARTGIRQFIAIGLCSGAFWAFHAALRNPDIRAAILLNPRLFFWDPGADSRRVLQRTARGLIRWNDWLRLARGGVQMQDVKRAGRLVLNRIRPRGANGGVADPPLTMAEAWEAFRRNRSRLTLVFTEGEPLLREIEEQGQLPPEDGSPFRCIRVPSGGHTFRPLWVQTLVHGVIDRELDRVIRERRQDAALRAG